MPTRPQAPEWERAKLATFAHDRTAAALHSSPEFRRAVDQIEASLAAEGAVVGPEQAAATSRDAALAIVLFVTVAGTKLVVAYQRHRPNIWFLILLAVVAVVGSVVIAKKRRTTKRGAARLASLRRLVSRSRSQSDPEATALMVGALGYVMRTPEFTGFRGSLHRYRRSKKGPASGSGCGSGGGASGAGGSGGGGCGGCGGD